MSDFWVVHITSSAGGPTHPTPFTVLYSDLCPSKEADVLLDAHLLDLGELVELGAAVAEHLDELGLGEMRLELGRVDAEWQLPPLV